jgi:hypothetical protein
MSSTTACLRERNSVHKSKLAQLITGQRDHAWLQAEPAYAKGRGKHIILIVQEDSGYNPTILGTDLEQIRFPRGQVEKAFIPILQELQNVRVRGL